MQFVGSAYEGERSADGKRSHGLGRYIFANGDCYVGFFDDGTFHGPGVIFYRKRTACMPQTTTTTTAQPHERAHAVNDKGRSDSSDADSSDDVAAPLRHCRGNSSLLAETMPWLHAHDEDGKQDGVEAWDGQYRGVWQHGRCVAGCYVFADGLVYGDGSSNSDGDKKRGSEDDSTQSWPYCSGNDHRLWQEYLHNVVPVLPCEAVLDHTSASSSSATTSSATTAKTAAATAAPSSAMKWAQMPVIVPSYYSEEAQPPAFAHGELRSGSALPPQWWSNDVATREAVAAAIYAAAAPLLQSSAQAATTSTTATQDARQGNNTTTMATTAAAAATTPSSTSTLLLSLSEHQQQHQANLQPLRVSYAHDGTRHIAPVTRPTTTTTEAAQHV